MWYCKNNFKKRGTNFINSKHAYYEKFCFILLESSVQFFIKTILYLSALVHVIENLRVNDILANFTVVQRYSVVRLLVDNILNHRYLINNIRCL